MDQFCDICKKIVAFVYHIYETQNEKRVFIGNFCVDCHDKYKKLHALNTSKPEMISCELAKYSIQHLYYIAPIENALWILILGILSRKKILSPHTPQINDISHEAVQDRRKEIILPSERPLHDYVPLYFTTHTPTQYIMTRTLKKNSYKEENKYPVIIEIDALSIFQTPDIFYSDGNAASAGTVFYDNYSELKNLDWDIIKKKQINIHSKEEKRKKAAEVLVPDSVPTSTFKRIITHSNETIARLKTKLTPIISSTQRHSVDNSWEYLSLYKYDVDQAHYF